MKIAVSPGLIGRALGVLLLVTFAAAVSYGITAWVAWNLNPGDWATGSRAVTAGTFLLILALPWLVTHVTVSDGPTEQQ